MMYFIINFHIKYKFNLLGFKDPPLESGKKGITLKFT